MPIGSLLRLHNYQPMMHVESAEIQGSHHTLQSPGIVVKVNPSHHALMTYQFSHGASLQQAQHPKQLQEATVLASDLQAEF